ncbi:type III PLP-dependent enzyme [Marivita geojedonensis]|uniref:type III PLP-dependent enzyme n=1 Tax=Marivita geojedonensis TaxID=1123756 RepID=UPI000A1EC510|nr:type III PLP-dependent enzyme [Marivita geojedonensis]PRY74680.1 ornithine decarboxylase [Marivita geojedonensis]
MSAGADDIKHARFDRAKLATWLRQSPPDDPVALFRPAALHRTAQTFLRGFPGAVSYAVKANPAPQILRRLARIGITTFDVASVAEMQAAREAMPTARLHYHNPIRSMDEVAQAKSFGVASWSVDRLSELDKLGALPENTEVAVRLSLGRGGGAYDFGSKFGARPEVATALLREVAARGFVPALTFHPGTQCTDPSSWADHIAACAGIARDAGVRLGTLNVGGGFPAVAEGHGDALTRIFETIRAATRTHFPVAEPRLWCEPGRAMVSDALWLLLRVKARSDEALYLNDGLYGALGEWRDMPVPGRKTVLDRFGLDRAGPQRQFSIFGPTCDSLDRVPGTWELPETIAEGDHILLTGAGAYSLALVTGFNGYGTRRLIDLSNLSIEGGQR